MRLGRFDREPRPAAAAGEGGEGGEGDGTAGGGDAEVDAGAFKVVPSQAFPLRRVPPAGGGADAAADAAAGVEGEGEGEDGSKARAGLEPFSNAGAGLEPLRSGFPPPFVVGGFRVAGGRARVEGLALPEDLPPGEYQLQVT